MAKVMLSVDPETRGRVKERKGDLSYDEYVTRLLRIEDEYDG